MKTLFSALCLFSLAGTTALAQEFEEETNNYIEIDEIGYAVTSFTDLTVSARSCGQPSGEIVIPEVVNMNDEIYHVTSIENDAFRDCVDITSIVIPNSVTSIGESAFWGCSGMTAITLSDNLTAISNYLFTGCTSLTSITIPHRVTEIGSYAFSGCTGLLSVSIPNSVKTIGNYAFSACTGLSIPIYNTTFFFFPPNYQGAYTIPDGIVTIQPSAFYQCTGLTSVSIPNSVTAIGSAAFSGCGKLATVTIPGSVTEIGSRAFENCPLKEIYIKGMVPPNENSKSNTTRAFSTAAFNHAILYVPVGTWDAYAYDDGWCYFINIREVAQSTQEISYAKAYTLMNTDDFNCTIYDPINGQLKTDMAAHHIDESNPNHCWQTVEKDGQTYLYNLGAKKFIQSSADGTSFTLSDIPSSITIENGEDGIVIGGQHKALWSFVVNEDQSTDQSLNNLITGIQSTKAQQQKGSTYVYDASGRLLFRDNLPLGIYYVNGKKVLVR